MNVVGGVERCGEIEKTRLNGFDIRFITSPFASNETKNTCEIKFWKIANQFVTVISLKIV